MNIQAIDSSDIFYFSAAELMKLARCSEAPSGVSFIPVWLIVYFQFMARQLPMVD